MIGIAKVFGGFVFSNTARNRFFGQLLAKIFDISPFGLTEIASSHVHGCLLKVPTAEQMAKITHVALEYNKEHWSVSTPEWYVRKTWKEDRHFMLGPL